MIKLCFLRKRHILLLRKGTKTRVDKGVRAAMIYLKRKIDTFLTEWKDDPQRKPLVIRGPRQVGKTESVRRFGKQHYKSVVEINFVEEPK